MQQSLIRILFPKLRVACAIGIVASDVRLVAFNLPFRSDVVTVKTDIGCGEDPLFL
jgi:hypothetical protein